MVEVYGRRRLRFLLLLHGAHDGVRLCPGCPSSAGVNVGVQRRWIWASKRAGHWSRHALAPGACRRARVCRHISARRSLGRSRR